MAITDLVRSALDRAMDVAREGEAATPVVHAPKDLVPLLSFQKLTGPASHTVWRVLEADDDFRARVLAATAADQVTAAGWLALSRPTGWRELLQAQAALQDEDRGVQAAEKRLRDLQRALEASERKREHAEAELAQHRDEGDAAHEELTALRRDRRRAEDALQTVERRVEELDQKLSERENRLAETQGAREAREHELAETRRQLADARAELERRPAPLVPGERPVDVPALREAAERLDRAAATLAKAVDGVRTAVPPEPVVLDGDATEPARVALVLPGGMVADSAEGARWLLAQPSVVLLVDGYNVAKAAWAGATLEDQRTRLVRALDDLVSRAAATAQVVFDGPGDTVPTARQGTPSVLVRYSDGELADDVIVDLIATFPVDRPVVVVSNDREVRDGARTRRANVIGSDTLIGLFGGQGG